MDITAIIIAIIGSGILNIILNYWIARKNEYNVNLKANRLVMKNILRELCMKYIEQGWIYEDELEDIITMHQCYHNELKGNGFLDHQMNHVKNLEVRGIGVK